MVTNVRKFLVTLALLGTLVALFWIYGEQAIGLFGDIGRLRAQIEGLGALGPLVLIALSVVQVVLAPLPGYPLVFAAGVLYGTWWGGLYANLGMLLAGSLAMLLTRRFGRPLAERFVEERHWQRLELLLSSNSVWLWFVVLLLPTGDYPYFAAGLSRVSFRTFFIALVLARVPFTWVLTNAAERSTELPTEAILVLGALLCVVLGIVYWQQERLSDWLEQLLERLHMPTMEKKSD